MGSLGLVVLLMAQIVFSNNDSITTDDIATSSGLETRSNLLAVLACGAVLIHGIGKLNVESVTAEAVALQGVSVPQPIGPASPGSVDWFLMTLVSATPATTAVLLTTTTTSTTSGDDTSMPTWRFDSAFGILSEDDPTKWSIPTNTPILNRYCTNNKNNLNTETYLPTLQALPGKTEFVLNSYLPSNTQAVLIVPVQSPSITAMRLSSSSLSASASSSVVVLGSNRARSFTPRDIAWCLALASRLGTHR